MEVAKTELFSATMGNVLTPQMFVITPITAEMVLMNYDTQLVSNVPWEKVATSVFYRDVTSTIPTHTATTTPTSQRMQIGKNVFLDASTGQHISPTSNCVMESSTAVIFRMSVRVKTVTLKFAGGCANKKTTRGIVLPVR